MLSFKENISIILNIIEKCNPKSILDIGCGFGKYGLLIREQYLSTKAQKGDFVPIDDIIIDAVEYTEFFLSRKVIYEIYNTVYKDDIFCLHAIQFEKYDLILMIDIIEHYPKDIISKFISSVIKNTSILISTPKNVSMYKEHYYGDSRTHITQWNESELINFTKTDRHTNTNSYILLLHKMRT